LDDGTDTSEPPSIMGLVHGNEANITWRSFDRNDHGRARIHVRGGRLHWHIVSRLGSGDGLFPTSAVLERAPAVRHKERDPM
jgi:hypothetical protein